MKLQLLVLPITNAFIETAQTTVVLNGPSLLKMQVKARGLGPRCIHDLVVIQFQELLAIIPEVF